MRPLWELKPLRPRIIYSRVLPSSNPYAVLHRHPRPGLPRHRGQQTAQLPHHVRYCLGSRLPAGAGGPRRGISLRPAPRVRHPRQRHRDDVQRNHPRGRQPAQRDAPISVNPGRRGGIAPPAPVACRHHRVGPLRSLRSEPVEQYFQPRDWSRTQLLHGQVPSPGAGPLPGRCRHE